VAVTHKRRPGPFLYHETRKKRKRNGQRKKEKIQEKREREMDNEAM
jgi:hypothetical protein